MVYDILSKATKHEINPCSCGGEGEVIKLFKSKRYDCFIRCQKCGYEGRTYTSKQNAVRAWNKRTAEKVKTTLFVKSG